MDPDMARQGWQDLQTLERLDNTAHRSPLTAHSSRFTTHGPRLSISALEMSAYMRNQLLRDTDWAGMAHSLEIRVPFVDVALLQSVAPWLAAYPGLTKSAIATAIAPQLPAFLLNKPKTGFSIPVRDWLMTDRPVRLERGLHGRARYIHKNHTGQTA
jgi:asparagine synthase (glutamine-hydrolysing)